MKFDPSRLPTFRLDQRRPFLGQKVIATAHDHLGAYTIPFPVEWNGSDFLTPNGTPIIVKITAWRPFNLILDRHTYKPSRVMLAAQVRA